MNNNPTILYLLENYHYLQVLYNADNFKLNNSLYKTCGETLDNALEVLKSVDEVCFVIIEAFYKENKKNSEVFEIITQSFSQYSDYSIPWYHRKKAIAVNKYTQILLQSSNLDDLKKCVKDLKAKKKKTDIA